MPKVWDPISVGRIELQKALYILHAYNDLYHWEEGGYKLKTDVLVAKELELRKQILIILTDVRFEKVKGYMHPSRVDRYKMLTRIRMFMSELRHRLNAMKR